jgi:lipopolysaccharide export system protein LptA
VNLRLVGVSATVVGLLLLPAGAAPTDTRKDSPAQTQTLGIDSGTAGGKALPVSIAADNGIEWRQADHVYIARGNVKAVRGTVTVYADEMRAYYRPVAKKPLNGKTNVPPPAPKPRPVAKAPPPGKPPKAGQQPSGAQLDEGPTEVYRVEAIGNVKFVTKTQTGYGDHADYDVDSTLLVMTGKHLKIVTPRDLLTARDTIEWYDNRQLGVARGDAVDIHDGKTIAADVLLATIVHPPGEEAHATRIDGHGHVFVSSKDQIGRGDTGVYDVKTGIVTLTDHVRLTRGQDEMRGNYGVVDVNRNIGYLLPRPPGDRVAGKPSHRVEALIVPNAKNGVPGAGASEPKKKAGTGKAAP